MTLDRGDIEALAREVAALLADSGGGAENETPRRFVDAATLARLLGISRATVYARADEFEAIRVGNGKRARLRFDVAQIIASAKGDGPVPRDEARRRRRRRRSPQTGNADLLPILGGRTGSGGPLRS
jgi:hypothetical protein